MMSKYKLPDPNYFKDLSSLVLGLFLYDASETLKLWSFSDDLVYKRHLKESTAGEGHVKFSILLKHDTV